MSECTHDCSSCGQSCASRNKPQSFIEKPHETSRIRRVVGIVSGKGGVGKSIVTDLLAVLASRKGLKTAVLDADITGPSVPRAFGVKEQAYGTEKGEIYPCVSEGGVKMMSLNLLTDDETTPVIWRGSLIAGTVKQFWKDVLWEDVDIMFIDMPPGTGDVPLTVFQSIPLDGIVIVTSPQELVGMIVEKAVNMANMMNIPVLGIVENMSYIACPDCGKELRPFGESRVDAEAEKHAIPVVAKLPIEPELARLCDAGKIEAFRGDWLDAMAESLAQLPARER
ncbi:MAG: Mrp/NBP35 family ATP-binding protein [Clostridia bacterium]|nr:Mrp/NBP35 family ATP-binding protein [Clostridia bacterium]